MRQCAIVVELAVRLIDGVNVVKWICSAHNVAILPQYLSFDAQHMLKHLQGNIALMSHRIVRKTSRGSDAFFTARLIIDEIILQNCMDKSIIQKSFLKHTVDNKFKEAVEDTLQCKF